jgi:hypothetical protein
MPCCQQQSQAAIGEFKTQDFATYLQLWHNHWYHYTKAWRNYSVEDWRGKVISLWTKNALYKLCDHTMYLNTNSFWLYTFVNFWTWMLQISNAKVWCCKCWTLTTTDGRLWLLFCSKFWYAAIFCRPQWAFNSGEKGLIHYLSHVLLCLVINKPEKQTSRH